MPAPPERVVLVHQDKRRSITSSEFAELEGLALAAGADVIARVTAVRRAPHPATFVGSGKAREIAGFVRSSNADLVILDQAVTPVQERNLESVVQCRVIDRARLILDIFALRARTSEGKLQVELAQLTHLATRLVRGWTHLERQRGGIGLRGPGETQLETDRRLIGKRIRSLRSRISKVRSQRQLRRTRRERQSVPMVTLVGYTNSGKTSIFNELTNSGALVADQLFATLDPMMRKLKLDDFGWVILSDTVGFVSGLPHSLVDAFHSTLEEVTSSRLLLHVIDSSQPDVEGRIRQVEDVLSEIGAEQVPRLNVYNKTDLESEDGFGIPARAQFDRGVRVSARTGVGIDQLCLMVSQFLGQDRVQRTLRIPPDCGRLRARAYQIAQVTSEDIDEEGNWWLQVVVDGAAVGKLEAQDQFHSGLWS
ncbi:MAG: ribosome rescue GTPase HflX [Pseudomonadota bacterium]|nr:ribosome rescue GTPase HflX [Pseudomonadota bacterium]